MIRNILVAVLSFVFVSCLSIDSNITLAADGSGTLELVYTVSSLVQDWESRDTAKSQLPLPVNENDFRRGLSTAAGLRLVSYTSRAAADSTVINAVIAFNSIEALNGLFPNKETYFTRRQEGGRNIFEQVVTRGSRGLDGETKSFVNAFLGPYSLKFTLTAPQALRLSTPSGAITGNKVTVSFPLAEVVGSQNAIVWHVEW